MHACMLTLNDEMGCFKQALVTIVASQCLLHCDDALIRNILPHCKVNITVGLVTSVAAADHNIKLQYSQLQG